MKDKLTENLGLKIIALLSSVFLWILVTAISDPAVSQSFYNIPVTLKNTEVLTDNNQVYKVLDGTDIISRVTVKAPHSVISELDESDIIATADINDLSSLDTISIKINTSKYSDKITSISGSNDAVKLSIEEKAEKTFEIVPLVTGALEENYVLGDVTLGQNLIKISGPESVINSIKAVFAKVDVTGFGNSKTAEVKAAGEINLFDGDGQLLVDDSLKMNVKSVNVLIKILKMQEVPIEYSVEGPAAPGYRATGVVEKELDVITIVGPEKDLEKISELKIPSDAIDISAQKANFATVVDLNNYLPAGIKVNDAEQQWLTVTIHISPETTRRIAISADNIQITNVPDGYTASVSIEDGNVVNLLGLSSDLSSLNVNNIAPTLDVTEGMLEHNMTEPEEGFFGMPLSFTLPRGVTVVDQVRATLHLVKEENGGE